MSLTDYGNRLALLAAYGPPEQRERARHALTKLIDDHEHDSEPAEDMGVQNDATQQQLHDAGVPYHGSVLLMELDAARVDQEAHDTLELVKRERRVRTCAERMLYLRETLLSACREQEPLKPWFYHALLTLAFIRRNTRVLRQTRETRSLPLTPACSADTEDMTHYDDYDLIDELRECSCCVRNVWHQLQWFLERMRMREFELQPLDEQERKWCHEHDVELRQIFLYLRGELRATNPAEYRAIWELLQKGHLDLAEMRRLWRGVKPHVLSRERAAVLLGMVSPSLMARQPAFATAFYKELSEVHSAVNKAFVALKTQGLLTSTDPSASPNTLPDRDDALREEFMALIFRGKGASSETSTLVESLYSPVHAALQNLWTACVRERINGNQLKALDLVLRHCMVDPDAVLKMARDSNISLRITEAIRIRWRTSLELCNTYMNAWQCFNNLDDVRPKIGGRDMAFSLWTIIRQSDKFQLIKTVTSPTADGNNNGVASPPQVNSALFANEQEALERSFLAMRCLARHSIVMNVLADAFVNQSLDGQWEVVDKEGIKRAQDYVRCIVSHEAWVEKYKTNNGEPLSEKMTVQRALTLGDVVVGRRDGVPETQCVRRAKKVENNPIAFEVFNMTPDHRIDNKVRWLVFAALIVPRTDLVKVLTRAHFARWIELYKVFCAEHAHNPDAPQSSVSPNTTNERN